MYQLTLLPIALTITYGVLILLYRRWFMKLAPFELPAHRVADTCFSIIIPARNEAKNISSCICAILEQDYPAGLFEIIVVNDHSTDETAAIVKELQQTHRNLHLIDLETRLQGRQLNSYKKKAIEIAIAEATGDWIITTDADCYAGPNWLRYYDAYIDHHRPVFIAGPVMYYHSGSFLSLFQLMDFISLQGITAAAVGAGMHAMCNGANMAYQKKAFYEVGQFRDIDQIASGDDMLLMQKIREKFPGKLGYLFNKEAIVQTESMPDWKSFLNQRIRWASKADRYRDKSIFWVLLLVYLLNLSLVLLAIGACFIPGYRLILLCLLLIKTITELSFMVPVGRFYGHAQLMIWFPLLQPFHILYTVIAGWLGKFGSYQWKGRKLQ